MVNSVLSDGSVASARRAGDAPRGGQPAAQRRLGNTTNNSSASDEQRLIRRFELQEAAVSLLPRERVCFCLRCGRSKEMGGVGVVYSASENRAHYDNVMVCGSVWLCPICAAKITEKRRQQLEEAFNRGTEAGLYFGLLSLTFSHGKTDVLEDILDKLIKAWALFSSGRVWKRLKVEFGLLEYCRTLETTHSWMNGWHPHHHVLLVLKAQLGADREADLAEILRDRWLDCLQKVGLFADLEHGAVFSSQNDYIAQYIAKWGHEPVRDPVGNKSRSFELTKLGSKLGRKVAVEHRTPFQILADYHDTGLALDGQLFQEYAAVFKGRRQLNCSRGFWERFGLEEEAAQTDEEVAAALPDDRVLVVSLPRSMWAVIVSKRLRAVLLVVVATGDWDLVERWLIEKVGSLPPPPKPITARVGEKFGAPLIRDFQSQVMPLIYDRSRSSE